MGPFVSSTRVQPPDHRPDVSIVIVTWNGRQYLDACLQAALGQQGVSFEVVLVDNASTDGTEAFVRARFPEVRIVRLASNAGFAGGSNAGARHARGRYLAMLNNDTVAAPDWLRRLLDGLDEAAGVVLATSLVVYMHDPAIVDSAGDGVLRAGGAFKRYHGEPADCVRVSGEVFGVCGAACLLPRHVFEELDGFDEAFFFSHEDVDLSYRARLRGYRCVYVAEAVVRHHGGATSGKASAFAVFHGQRNIEWMYLKNTPTVLLLQTLPGHLLYDLAAAVHFARAGTFGAFARGKIAAIAGLPRVWRQRRHVQATRRIASTGIARVMQRRWLRAKLREKRFDARVGGANP